MPNDFPPEIREMFIDEPGLNWEAVLDIVMVIALILIVIGFTTGVMQWPY